MVAPRRLPAAERRCRSYNRRAVTIERQPLPADERFWPQAGRAVLDFAARHGAADVSLAGLTWLVPSGAQAQQARGALRDALGGRAFMPPRLVPLAAWLGQPLGSGTAARAELFSALRASRWVRESFGAQPAALWSLAAAVAQLGDELTYAAVGDIDTFADRLQSSLARHYRRRAARAVQPQAQLVLQLWRARQAADDGAAAALRTLQQRVAQAEGPLVYLCDAAPGAEPAGWELAFLQRWAQRAPVLLLQPDLAAALAPRPLLAAAWPELVGETAPRPLAARGDAVRGAAPPRLVIVEAATLEDEAVTVAQQVLDWRRDGLQSIALVALDRFTARRTRALLERAQVLVRDETGWKLSTTSAAAAVMRWFDVVADDLYWRDLLDWAKSSFTLAHRPDKAAEVDAIERAIRAEGALQGARAIRAALAGYAGKLRSDAGGDEQGDLAAAAQAADDVLALIVEQQRLAARAGPTLADHLRALDGALDALGTRAALAADPVGRCVLRELDALAAELAGTRARASLAEFRALLAARFEEAAFVDTQVDSPVVMVSAAAAALRPFDAAVLIGADARHLPAAPQELLFLSNAVRAELGLATAEAHLRAQAAQLASLLATVPQVVAVWRGRLGDEPNALSPLLQRLNVVAERALGRTFDRGPAREAFDVPAQQTPQPAPAAAALLPARLSASDAQALVDCPYRFYARRLLQLAEPEDVIELPDKRDFGEALHAVLKRFHDEWGGAAFEALDAAVLAASLRRHAEAVFGALTQRTPAMLAFARRFDGLIDGYVDWLRRHAADGWRWAAGEVRCRRPLPLPGGGEVTLHGRIDRIDADAAGRQRLIDYKARAPDRLAASLKVAGEDLQLPFYALLLDGRPDSAAYVSFDRAREGDGGVTLVEPPQPFADLTQAVGERLRRDLQRIADGAPLPAIGAAAVCAYCEMRGLCRRDYWERGNGDGAQDAA